MLYCRKNETDSDVYIIGLNNPATAPEAWMCCRCTMYGVPARLATDKRFSSQEEVLEHLIEHRRIGDKVPSDAVKRLRKEIKDRFLIMDYR